MGQRKEIYPSTTRTRTTGYSISGQAPHFVFIQEGWINYYTEISNTSVLHEQVTVTKEEHLSKNINDHEQGISFGR